ncbi:hypothetical protein EXN66_Car000009 [Channa argus]|uniref:Uncharacterized protein n=1 Tax=Channa argus TaxID=215402 RepID=A0A6G1QWZ0_CHAAH|nr:hypothetical protein EXN66_Car000009 [Channa argus]
MKQKANLKHKTREQQAESMKHTSRCGVGESNNDNKEDSNHDGRDHINNNKDLAGE